MGRSLEQYEREKAYTGRWGIPGAYMNLFWGYLFQFIPVIDVASDIWQRWKHPTAERHVALWLELVALALFWLVGWVMVKCARYTLALDRANSARHTLPPTSPDQV